MVLGVIGVSTAGAQGLEQSFLLRELSRSITPVDYSIGALVAIDPATRSVVEAGITHLYSGDLDAFVRVVAPHSRHRLRERFLEVADAMMDDRVPVDSIRIAPVQDDRGMGQGYALRLIQGSYAVTGEVWVGTGTSNPMIEDLVIDFGNREMFGDDSHRFAPGGARTVW